MNNDVFSLADEADLTACDLNRCADVLADVDPVMADNLRRAAERLRASLRAEGHHVTEDAS
ncbi:hypothetical protein G6030_02345 [Dietzia sp. E1]|uniref:hypothetical protein n=1 Tax=Dietzia sp. E1 TaxID=328361 RepID=UPI0015FB7B32|nr:hypothetical protein [Dietzia sp. E1]MBB1020142.1 hypothetical protein [Dietzia sp. E1]